jgi:hypothetical protein
VHTGDLEDFDIQAYRERLALLMGIDVKYLQVRLCLAVTTSALSPHSSVLRVTAFRHGLEGLPPCSVLPTTGQRER